VRSVAIVLAGLAVLLCSCQQETATSPAAPAAAPSGARVPPPPPGVPPAPGASPATTAGSADVPSSANKPIRAGETFVGTDVKVTPHQPVVETASVGSPGNPNPTGQLPDALVLRFDLENTSSEPLASFVTVSVTDPQGKSLFQAGLHELALKLRTIQPGMKDTQAAVFVGKPYAPGEYKASVQFPSHGNSSGTLEFRFKL
jgi:hypothetical protein